MIKIPDRLHCAPVHSWTRDILNCHYIFHTHMWLMAATMKGRVGKSWKKKIRILPLFSRKIKTSPRFSLSQRLGYFYRLGKKTSLFLRFTCLSRTEQIYRSAIIFVHHTFLTRTVRADAYLKVWETKCNPSCSFQEDQNLKLNSERF